MRIGSTMRISFRALLRNKMRSILTALGIIIGVSAVIAMVSIGNGAKAQVESQIASLGQNVILVFAGSTTSSGIRLGKGSAATLKVEDADAISDEIGQVAAISPEIRTTGQVAGENQNWASQIFGESEDYFDLRQWPFAEGGGFTEQDVRGANKVAVVGKTIAQQLFGNDSPIGEILRIKNVPFVIVGVLTPKGFSIKGVDQDDVVIMPYTSAMKRLSGHTGLYGINVEVKSASDISSAQEQITGLLRQRHRILPGRDDDFTVRNQQEIAQTAMETSRVMTVLLAAIASVSLVVGGIGIMNIMLVSVTERTREIGIRIAVGAHGRDILLQFLIEAATLSSTGGIVGILVGVATSKILSATADWPTVISPESVIVAFLFSLVVGVFFGYYPARKASDLDPIDALRYE